MPIKGMGKACVGLFVNSAPKLARDKSNRNHLEELETRASEVFIMIGAIKSGN